MSRNSALATLFEPSTGKRSVSPREPLEQVLGFMASEPPVAQPIGQETLKFRVLYGLMRFRVNLNIKLYSRESPAFSAIRHI